MADYKKLIDELPAPQTKEEQYIYALVCSVADVENKNKLSDSPFWRLEKYWRAFYLITAESLKKNNDVIAGIQDNVSANTDNIAINTKSIETNAGNIFSNTRDIKRNADGIDRLDAVKANVKHKHVMADITDLDIKPKWEDIEGKPDFATVATTGSYNDLLDKPILTDYYTKSEIDALLAASGGGDGITLTPQQIANLNADHSKYLTAANLNGYATESWVNQQGYIKSLSGYATEQWVTDKGYLTEHQDISGKADKVSVTPGKVGYDQDTTGSSASIPYFNVNSQGLVTSYGTRSFHVSGFATPEWVRQQGYLTEHQSLSGYATETYVNSQGFLTAHQSLNGYATEAWVNQQGFLTQHQSLDGKQDKLSTQQLANINADHSKYLTEHQSLAGYATENWVSQQGYLTEHQDISNVERVAAKKLSNNGYYKTESGLIIQWGVVTTTTANSWKTTDFPTPFTTRNYSVCVTDRNGTAVTRAYNLSASQVNILSTVATTVQWIAIGY